MAKLPAFAKAFVGRWRIVEMDVWDKDFLDLVETAHLTFKGAADGGKTHKSRNSKGDYKVEKMQPLQQTLPEYLTAFRLPKELLTR